MRRTGRLPGAVALLATAALSAGCGAASPAPVTEPSLRLQNQTRTVNLRQPAEEPVAREIAYDALAAASTPTEATRALAAVQSSGPLGVAMSESLCAGMDQLTRFTGSVLNWGDFLVDQMLILMPGVSDERVIEEVSALLAVWDLNRVTPTEALVYREGCF
jgi:hypothetical protein